MNLASIDLNLLVAFEALIEERHVTRAGQRIGLAQPSMSSALMRLRVLFEDELFIRTASGMQPTARALALAGPVGDALNQIRGVLAREPGFDPAVVRHRFTIAVTDYGDLVVVPPLVTALRQEAPGVDLTVRPIVKVSESLEALEHGEIDVLIGGHLPDSPRTIRRVLFEERFACIQAAGAAPSDTSLSADDYVRRPHVLFSSAGGDGAPGAVDKILAQTGLHRRVAMTLPHVTAVPFAVAGTDLIATMAERIARQFAKIVGISIVRLPYDVLPFAIDLVYVRRAQTSPATQWLIDVVSRVCRDL
jgi:DNA-binding transcriptional LysR family regulator